MKNGKNPLWFPCNTGMHQEFGQYAAPPGTIYSVTNSRLDPAGVIVKRGGMTGVTCSVPSGLPAIVGDGSTYAEEKPRFLTTVGETAVIGITNGDVFARNEISGDFIFSGRHSTALPVRKRKGDVGGTQTGTALAYSGQQPAIAVNSTGYVLFACQSGPGSAAISKVFLETADGTRVRFDRVNNTVKIQALAVGATLYVIYQVGTEIFAATVSPTTGVSSGTLVGTLNTGGQWDTSAYDSSHWFLVFQDGAATMRVDKFSGTTSVANATWAVTGTCPVSIFASTDLLDTLGGNSPTVWVGYYNNPTVTGDVAYRVRRATTLGEVLGETIIVSAADIYGPPLFGRYYNAASPTQAIAALYTYRVVNTTGNQLRAMGVGVAYNEGTTATTPVLTYHCIPISKPDRYNRIWVQHCPPGGENAALGEGRTLLLRFDQKSAGSAVFPVLELSSPPFPWLGTDGPEESQTRFHAIARSSTRSYWAFPQTLANLTGSPLIGITVYEYTVSDQESVVDAVPLDITTAIAGVPTEAFGFLQPTSAIVGGLAEIGFAHRPTIISATQASGSGIAAGTYSYVAVYEWADMDGRRHRSAPSLPVSLTLTDTDDATVVVSALYISQRTEFLASNGVSVQLYRTTNGGTAYHRTGSAATIANGSATFTDQASDSSLSDNEFLYTDGGVLPNTLGPSCRFMAKSEDRLWCGGLWDPSIIECSKILVPGEPVQFTNDATHQVVLPRACTGLAYMDGNVVAFANDEIYVIGGDGPNDQGIGSFPPPRKLAQGIGCIDYRSIVETNIGVMFQSRRGIEFLPRGFGPVQYVGRNVKDVFQVSGLTECIGSAAFCDSAHNLARFLMKAPAGTGSTNILTFDVDRGEWFQDTVSQEAGAMGVWPDGVALAATTMDSALAAPIWYENGAQLGDGSTNAYVSQTLTWARIYPFPGSSCGWGNFNRVQMALEPRGVSQVLTITASVDTASSEVRQFTVTSSYVPAHREIHIVNRNGSGLSIFVSDSTAGVATAGFRWLGLALEVDTDGSLHIVNTSNDERR